MILLVLSFNFPYNPIAFPNALLLLALLIGHNSIALCFSLHKHPPKPPSIPPFQLPVPVLPSILIPPLVAQPTEFLVHPLSMQNPLLKLPLILASLLPDYSPFPFNHLLHNLAFVDVLSFSYYYPRANHFIVPSLP